MLLWLRKEEQQHNAHHRMTLPCQWKETRKLREQATQSTRRMPRRNGPMKDVETDETFRGSCIQAMIPETPNGATPPE